MKESFFTTMRKKPVTSMEVNEYLTTYPARSITTERASDFHQSGIFFTVHRYQSGLIFYLKWQATTDYLEDEFPTIHLLFTLRNRGFYLPKGFDIILPREEIDYQTLEYQTSSPLLHSDEAFIQFMRDIESALRFEAYYEQYKKNRS